MRKLFLLCIILLAAAVSYGQEVEKPRVLLAFEKTLFKTQLIDAMKKELEQAGCEVTVIEHSKKGLVASADDYDAIFITNSGVNSKVRPWITEWLDGSRDHKDRILLHTTQTRDWKVLAEVDAVTSASSRKNVNALAAEYTERLKKIIAER